MSLTNKDRQFLRLVLEGARTFSTCAKAQYFAILVDPHGHIIGTGYNGGPKGSPHCTDGGCPRHIAQTPSGAIYDDCIAIHAEENALLHSDYTTRRDGCTLYVNGQPCWQCTKALINGGVTRLVYLEDGAGRPFAQCAALLNACAVRIDCADAL